MEAAMLASQEIGFTIVSMTISLVAVFIPVLFMGGIVGRLLHEFSVTITVAILISGFVSLTLDADARQPVPQVRTQGAPRALVSRARSAASTASREPTTSRCKRVLRHPFATVMFALAMLGGTVYLFMNMPTGFIPSQDTGFIQGATLASQDISFESMAKHQRAVGDILEHDPNCRADRRIRRRQQPGLHLRDDEAAPGTKAERGSSDDGAARQPLSGPRRDGVPAESAAHHH